jgi:hypothetical protein
MNSCEMCNTPIDTGTHTHYTEVTGWAKVTGRKRASMIIRPITLDALRCTTCMEKHKQIPGQEELF